MGCEECGAFGCGLDKIEELEKRVAQLEKAHPPPYDHNFNFLEKVGENTLLKRENDSLRKKAYMEWCPFGAYKQPHPQTCVCGGDTSRITWEEWHENQSQGYALKQERLDTLNKMLSEVVGVTEFIPTSYEQALGQLGKIRKMTREALKEGKG